MSRTQYTPHKHRPRLFRAGDRVTHIIPGRPHGMFVMYCPGYLSHCVVRWDDLDGRERRVKVDHISLVERPSHVQ